ncbi:hypothetical protein ACHAWF_008770 [Thalassiosira exigua]
MTAAAASAASFPPMPRLTITAPETLDRCATLPLRPSDVYVCSYPKSGTTWVQHVVLSLLLADRRCRRRRNAERSSRGEPIAGGEGDRGGEDGGEDDATYDHVSDFAPFFEVDAHWDPSAGAAAPRLAERVRRNHDRLGRRVFNTHLRWDMLPKWREGGSGATGGGATGGGDRRRLARPECGKFVYVTRDLRDVCVSFYHHLSNQREGTYAGSFRAFALDWMAGNLPFGSPLHHLLSFAEGFSDNMYASGESTNDKPLLLLSYERMKSDLRGEVLRIIDFLNLDAIPDDVLEKELLPSFDFRAMKADAGRFQPRSVGWLNNYEFLRRGETGDGRRAFAASDDGQEGLAGPPLVAAFRAWVDKEEYRRKVGELMYRGLDGETAKRFQDVVW